MAQNVNTKILNNLADYSYTVSGSNGTCWPTGSSTSIDWANTTITTGTGTGASGYYYSNINNPATLDSAGTLELRGNNADIKVNGRSLMSAIDAIEQRLNILTPNPELEAEWDELRELGERYRALEKQCKEKGEMWNKLKSLPDNE